MKLALRFSVLLGLVPCLLAGSQVATAATGTVTLGWTAPGDDSLMGRAFAYDIRYSLATITAANFFTATQATGIPAPRAAGSPEVFTVTNLLAGRGYYFAIKTVDDDANWSGVSNIISFSVHTAAVLVPPATLWLSSSWPNPARETARWSYALPRDGRVELDAFDLSGRHVRSIVSGWRSAGQGDFVWDLRDDVGRSVAAGLYMVRASLGGQTWVKRLVVTY